MGYISHHAIVVTGTYGDHVERAHQKAIEIFDEVAVGGYFSRTLVSPLSEVSINSTQSFCVFPDGSKEGWEMSDEGDTARARFIKWLIAQRYDDGSSPLAWVHVQYGDDEGLTATLSDSDEAKRNQEKPE